MKKSIKAIAIIATAALAACSGGKGWQVSGTVDGAPANAKVALEGFNGGFWYLIDSLDVKNGKFSYKAEAPQQYSEVYRLSYDGNSIYFPVSATDAVTVNAAADGTYELAGTPAAVDMMNVDRMIAQAVAAQGAEAVLTDSLFKREINNIVLSDSAGIISYYIINKNIGGKPLYSTANRRDVAMLGAIANKFQTMFPQDPRTQYLADRYMQARKESGLSREVLLNAVESGLVEISLFDEKGAVQKLSDATKGAAVTLLSFTSYNIEPSVPYNMELNRLRDLFGSDKLSIYQVSLDGEEAEWRRAAANLPWTTVLAMPGQAETLLLTYNVASIPLTYVIDRNGDLAERIEDATQLETAVRKHMK